MIFEGPLKSIKMDSQNRFFIAENALFFSDEEHGASTISEAFEAEIDLVMLCTLEEILTGLNWEEIFDQNYINPAWEESPDGPWIYAVSDRLVETLTSFKSASTHPCIKQWMETDDWTLRENACPDEVIRILEELILLSKQASREGKRLFLRATI